MGRKKKKTPRYRLVKIFNFRKSICWKNPIEFPLALPHMMLCLNQTIVFALFMVIIGAFIGTEDLGQYILKAISDKKGAGIGLTLGLCVAFIGLIFDNLIRTWVEKRKKHLGID